MVSLDELSAARQNMIEAWDAQSKTTVEDGFTLEQANAAIVQAMNAQREYDRVYDEYDRTVIWKRQAEDWPEWEEIDVTPMGGW